MEKNNQKNIHCALPVKRCVLFIKKYSTMLLLSGVVISVWGNPVALAHVTGNSWEQVYGDYKVDVGYDPATFMVGEPQRLDFNVVKEIGGEDVPFADVWVRVSQGNKTVFASGIHKPSLGKTGMTFTFPEAGEYLLSGRFEKDGNTIVEASFPITVQVQPLDPAMVKAAKQKTILLWAGWSVAILSAGVAVYAFSRKRKST